MVFSLLVAFVVSPWAAVRMLHTTPTPDITQREREDWITRLYRRLMGACCIQPAACRWIFLGGVVVLLLASGALFYLR